MQYHTDLLLRTSHVLKSNIEVLKSLSSEAKKRQHLQPPELIQRYEVFDEVLESAIREHKFIRNYANNVRDRADRVTLVVSALAAERTLFRSVQSPRHSPLFQLRRKY